MHVMKKNGSVIPWNENKIIDAVLKSSDRAEQHPITEEEMKDVLRLIDEQIASGYEQNAVVSTQELHHIVLHALSQVNKAVYTEYKAYRNYKERYAKSFSKTRTFSEQIVYSGDKENANKDSDLNSTKQALISEEIMRNLMVNFELPTEWVKAHEEGWIHIHDLGSRYLKQINCCLFDMGNLLKGGFELNGARYLEPGTPLTAWSVIGDVTLSASSQQYGGFTIPEIDTVMAKYCEEGYEKYLDYYLSEDLDEAKARKLAEDRIDRENLKGIIGLETKLNTISNSLGQVPFVTMTFGLDTSYWGRKITSTLLSVRREGMGGNKMTAIFPKLVFIHRNDVNGLPGTENFDLYKEAIECSRTRLYPDYLSLDGEDNNLREVYERSGKVVSGMGCRAYLSPFYHPETGEELYTGRNNIGAVSLNLVKMAIESGRDEMKFYDLIKKYSDMVFAIHEDAYEKIGKSKGSSNPLLFCEGASWMSVGYDEEIRPIIEASTASLGYVGLEEVCQCMFGEHLLKHQDFALTVVTYLKQLTVAATEKFNHLYALYSTPAENLVYKFNTINRAQYGVIENVTSREYETNSFHLHVAEEVSVPQKIAFEAPFHAIATGGRISYCEFPYGVDRVVLRKSIDFAMEKGMYFGANVISATCCNCGKHGDFDVCPDCGSEDIISVSRVCGYLSFGKVKGDSRYNLGKQAEIRDRVKHATNFNTADVQQAEVQFTS